MGRKNSDEYERAKCLYGLLVDLQDEIRIIDRAIAQLQVTKAEYEMNGGKVTPFFGKYFMMAKRRNKNRPDEILVVSSQYDRERSIMLSEAELVMLRAFKQGRIDELNEEVKKLSERINED